MSLPAGPALGLIELCSVARGLRVVDALVKRSPVRVLEAGAIMPGKFLVRLGGGVDEVFEALVAGKAAAGDALVDSLLLPYPHDQLVTVLTAPRSPERAALGVIEGFSVTGIVRGADATLKAAEVEALRLDRGPALGGKAAFYFTGALHDVEAGMAAGLDALGAGLLAGHEIIANPHADLLF